MAAILSHINIQRCVLSHKEGHAKRQVLSHDEMIYMYRYCMYLHYIPRMHLCGIMGQCRCRAEGVCSAVPQWNHYNCMVCRGLHKNLLQLLMGRAMPGSAQDVGLATPATDQIRTTPQNENAQIHTNHIVAQNWPPGDAGSNLDHIGSFFWGPPPPHWDQIRQSS